MRRLRGILTGIALIGLSAISLVAAGQVAWQGLQVTTIVQEPYRFERLYTEDLLTASATTQRQFIRGLENDLEQGVDWQSRMDALDDEQRTRFETNLTLLAEVWFNGKVDRYFELPPGERDAYLDGMIAQIERQVGTASAATGRGGKKKRKQEQRDQERGTLALFGNLVLSRSQQWIDEAPPERQEQLQEFQSAVQTRFLLRALEQAGQP